MPVDAYAEDMVRAVLECLDDGLVFGDVGHWGIFFFSILFFFWSWIEFGAERVEVEVPGMSDVRLISVVPA